MARAPSNGCTRRAVIASAVACLATGLSRRAGAASPAPPSSDGFVTLEAARGRPELGGAPRDAWCFGGTMPGPVIRARHGDEVKVRLVNRLDVPLSLHWHGVQIANPMDGVAGLTQPSVAPGSSFDYRFTPPDSGSFLYRPVLPDHPLGPLGAGLHGVLIVEEREPPAVEHEFVLAMTSVRLDAAGRLAAADATGATILGIGARSESQPVTLPQRARVRLRIVNAAQNALLLLGVEGARHTVVAIDSQPCEPFAPARGFIPIGPGARFDVMLDLPRSVDASTRVTLRDALDTTEAARAVLQLRTGERMAPEHPATADLPRNPRLPEAIALERAARAQLLLRPPSKSPPHPAKERSPRAMRAVLSAKLDAGKPMLSVKRGAPIAFALVNPSDQPVSVHIHGHTTRVLHDLDDGWHPYWRDTVLIEARKIHHAAFVADNPGKWLVSAQSLGTTGSSWNGVAWYEVRR